MIEFNQKRFSNIGLLIVSTLMIITITACSEIKEKKKLDKESAVNENKPVVTTSKPKTTKPVSELEKISKEEQNSEIKIIPNRFPYDENKKKQEKVKS